MTSITASRTAASDRRPATSRTVVALAAVLAAVAVRLVSLLATPTASASPLVGARNAVGVIAVAAGQRVGAHEAVPAGEGRIRAPGYDRSAVGSCVAPETESSTASDLADATCGGQSFTPSTDVELADGRSLPLDQVQVGDKVLATNPQTGKTQAEPVTKVWVNHDTDLLDLTIHTATGNTVVDTTQHHLFYDLTTHNWVQAENLHPGDRLYTADGLLATVVGTVVVPGAADMWDLTVNNNHDFYVDTLTTAVLVHNCPVERNTPYGNNGEPPPLANSHRNTDGGMSPDSDTALQRAQQAASDNTSAVVRGPSDVTPNAWHVDIYNNRGQLLETVHFPYPPGT